MVWLLEEDRSWFQINAYFQIFCITVENIIFKRILLLGDKMIYILTQKCVGVIVMYLRP